MFKYKLNDEVLFKDNQFIIIGRMDAVNAPNRYMLQDIESYKKSGYRFDKGSWEYEDKLILIK